jgi:hypothetical protein
MMRSSPARSRKKEKEKKTYCSASLKKKIIMETSD